MKLRNKINLSFALIFAVSLLAISIIFDAYSTNLVKNNIYAYLTSSNRARAEHIRTFIKEKEKTAVILAAASVYRDLLKEPTISPNYKIIKGKIDKRLARTLESDTDIHQVLILDKKGLIIAASDKTEEGTDKSQDEFFINGQKGVYFKSIYYSGTVKSLVYAISAPVLDDDGTFLGLSVLRYSADDFYSVVASENGLGSTEENFIINKDKFFITPSRFLGDEVILKQKVETENERDCFDPEEIEYTKKNGYGGLAGAESHAHIVEAKDYRGIDITGTHAYIPETGWCLITKVDTADLLAYRYNLILFTLGIFLIAGLVLFFFGYFVAKKITNALGVLVRLTEKIKRGDYNFKADIKSKDEIGELSESFGLMAEGIKKSRSEVDKKVKEQTKEIVDKQKSLADQQKATLNVLEDVEEEKQRTDKEKSKAEAILASIGDGMIATDQDGRIIVMNKAAENLLGWKVNEVLDKLYADVIFLEDENGAAIPLEQRPIMKAYRSTTTTTTTTTTTGLFLINKNKIKFPVAITVAPVILDKKIIGVVEVFRDITMEKQIDKAKTEFVSLASHQLRTPLSAINWYTEMLIAGDAGKMNKTQKEYLDVIYKGNQRMVDLVNSLLNVSRLDMGTFTVEPELIDLQVLAGETIGELMPQIKPKKLKLTETYGDKLAKYMADPKLMKIIFQNLLSNAVKYTPNSGKIDLSVVQDKKSILITVKDSGYGITKSQQDKIFTKMFRADNVREKDTEGTGLGLYLVKSIVDTAGGKVWFESIENKGSTFYVSMPLEGMKKKEGTKQLS